MKKDSSFSPYLVSLERIHPFCSNSNDSCLTTGNVSEQLTNNNDTTVMYHKIPVIHVCPGLIQLRKGFFLGGGGLISGIKKMFRNKPRQC